MAYRHVEPKIPTIHTQILGEMWACQWRDDWTCRELASQLKEYAGTISPRLVELERLGRIERSQVRQCHVSRRRVQTWRLVS